MTSTMAALVERNRAHLAAYSAADFGDNGFAAEEAFLATADTEAGDILCSNPPAVRDHADLTAALAYVVEDRDFVQAPHERILRRALEFLNDTGPSASLSAAIENHRSAKTAADAAQAALDDMMTTHDEGYRYIYETSDGVMVYGAEGQSQLDVFGVMTPIIFQQSRSRRMREACTHSPGSGLALASNDRVEEADRIYREDLQARDATTAQIKRQWVEMGGETAEMASDAADTVEAAMWKALLSSPCRTAEDARAKAAYLLSDLDFSLRLSHPEAVLLFLHSHAGEDA